MKSAPSLRALLPVLLLGTMLAGPALAQQRSLDGRVDRLEKEMQAVQRKVFPGGAGQIVAPDVTPEAPPPAQIGSPASAPIADLTARVNAIESQLARLTGQSEENGFKLRQLEESYARLNAQVEALKAAAAPPEPVALPPAAITPAPAATRPAAGATRPPASKPVEAASQARIQQVAAIERPNTGNAALDNYTYGFRLWTSKFYPEAQTQLQLALDNYPNDPAASRIANLLGRAYLDDGKPTQAAKILFENYRLRPKGDRAAESLAWTGEALIQLKRFKEACMAYDELTETFTGILPANVADMMTKGRARAKCGA